MDTELDTSAPAGHRRTPATDAALAQLIADTERVVERGRRRRRTGIGAAALSVALIGGVGAAAATGSLTGWWNDPDATTHQISGCEVTFAPRALRDPHHPVSAEDRAAATAAAAAFLRRFDESTLVGLSSDAIYDELNARLVEHLERQGLSTYAVSVALATDCGDQ